MRDAITRIRTETVINTYMTVRCAKCRYEFEVQMHDTWTPRTTKCRRYGCGHRCDLTTADRVPEALPPNVVPLFGRAS